MHFKQKLEQNFYILCAEKAWSDAEKQHCKEATQFLLDNAHPVGYNGHDFCKGQNELHEVDL